MFKVTATITRQQINDPFYRSTAEYKDWFQTNYIDTFKCDRMVERDPENLTKTTITLWRSKEDFEEFTNSKMAKEARAERDAHNDRYGIIRTVTREEI